jgi:predicted DNA-binding protein
MTVMAMTLQISDSLDDRLNKYTARSGVSKNKVVLDAIEAYLNDEELKPATRGSVQRIVARDTELLDRLSDA